ncbi:hypothetical protein TYRP_007729 [Tyrophagus putrescentiae]|nr:hypothetical protein TYRP_007729 [Tyrophagus putrescentiae]
MLVCSKVIQDLFGLSDVPCQVSSHFGVNLTGGGDDGSGNFSNCQCKWGLCREQLNHGGTDFLVSIIASK